MRTDEIRKRYLDFFEKKGHTIVPSALLVPENDPTTLFTGSGMQPMLQYFLGTPHPLGRRIADSQRCFRSQDIEEVGDNRHTTFFEMLGNWSFGDYFKEEQISWMWEFLVEHMGLDPRNFYVTCFKGTEALGIPRDTESAHLWQKLFASKGIKAAIGENPEQEGMRVGEHIFYYDEKKNWWTRSGLPEHMPVGEPGGPDTEMFYDFDPDQKKGMHETSAWKERPCHVNCDCGRFLEIGNNVFMQYKKTTIGFEELPQMNVDHGSGLERYAAALRDDPDIFNIDIFSEAKNVLIKQSGQEYGKDERVTYAMRVILDHVRAATFLVCDGVLPSNKDQGYFVRRLIRRALRYGRDLGIQTSFVGAVSECFIQSYEAAYPELSQNRSHIVRALVDEEEKFRKTLEKGLRELERKAGSGSLSGKDAFELFSTYGFPWEMTRELAKEKGLALDEKIFREEFKKHQELSRTASAGKFKGGLADSSEKTTMLHTATHLMLAGLRKHLGEGVHQAGSNITEERTRFDFTYPEKVPRDVLDKVETYVNEAIGKKSTVSTEIMEKNAAREAGVEGSFWEKYPDQVTVYVMKSADGTIYSKELCGGPHVETTENIRGTFRIIKEEASSAGIRRIKAILE